VLVALDAERPLLAGILLACGAMTRPTLLLTAPFFALEAIRVHCKEGLPTEGTFLDRVEETWRRLDKTALAKSYAIFAAPILAALGLASAMNSARFHNPSPFAGHEYLGVVWKGRIAKWGLFGYHYLSKNLGAMLTITPWIPPKNGHGPGVPPFQINEHGLALWFTTPLYFWLFRPKARTWLYDIVALTAGICCVMNLLYQNSGWRQFGYRFSNDYVVLLFVLLAIGSAPGKAPSESEGADEKPRPWLGSWVFRVAAIWAIGWNLFGAITFDRGGPMASFYFGEGTQTVLYQPD
jgi:hypothetical protein